MNKNGNRRPSCWLILFAVFVIELHFYYSVSVLKKMLKKKDIDDAPIPNLRYFFLFEYLINLDHVAIYKKQNDQSAN